MGNGEVICVRCAYDGEREVLWVGLRDDRQQLVANTALLDVPSCSVIFIVVLTPSLLLQLQSL